MHYRVCMGMMLVVLKPEKTHASPPLFLLASRTHARPHLMMMMRQKKQRSRSQRSPLRRSHVSLLLRVFFVVMIATTTTTTMTGHTSYVVALSVMAQFDDSGPTAHVADSNANAEEAAEAEAEAAATTVTPPMISTVVLKTTTPMVVVVEMQQEQEQHLGAAAAERDAAEDLPRIPPKEEGVSSSDHEDNGETNIDDGVDEDERRVEVAEAALPSKERESETPSYEIPNHGTDDLVGVAAAFVGDVSNDDEISANETTTAGQRDSNSSMRAPLNEEQTTAPMIPTPRSDGTRVAQPQQEKEQLRAAAERVKEAIRSREPPPRLQQHLAFDEKTNLQKDEEEAEEEVDLMEEGEQVENKENREDEEAMASQEETEEEDVLFDDRTLLDIFGEVTKEYLTQRVIPGTDTECKWDWRSFRCEPACHCSFLFQAGDYHLGRACRRRKLELAVCEPTVYIQDKQVPKRILSLIRQTSDILKGKVKRTVGNAIQSTSQKYAKVQENVCFDLWSRLQEIPTTGGSCWSSFPVTTTIPEKIFCGRIDVPVCDDGPFRTVNAPVATAAAAAAKLDRRKERIFADLYEKEF